MNRPRIRIALLMAAVTFVALDFAVIRAFPLSSANDLPHLFFACGVIPMASLLTLVVLAWIPTLKRGGSLSPFVLGFEAVGWVMVFAFVTWYSLAPRMVLHCAEVIGRCARPLVSWYFADMPIWLGLVHEFGMGTVIFSLPQLIAALVGGLLMRKLGLTLRFERSA